MSEEPSDEAITKAVQQWIHDVTADICPHCQKPISDKKQVGRCVYALPCYHRLYQGTLPKREKSIEDHPYFREQEGK